jgi:hypothetical protein
MLETMKLSDCRRNYSGLFEDILLNSVLAEDPSFRLYLIGRGNLHVPPVLQGKVFKELNLPYPVWLPSHGTRTFGMM